MNSNNSRYVAGKTHSNAKNDIKNKIVVIFASVFAGCMVIMPEITEIGSKAAIIIWANSIVPVLLPFFIFSDFIKRTGNLQSLPPGIYPFIIAFLSGYPMGAKIVGDFTKEKTLTISEGKQVLSYSLVTGPAFIIFTIGEFIGSTRAAVVVAAAHYLGALLNGILHKDWVDFWTGSKPRSTKGGKSLNSLHESTGKRLQKNTTKIDYMENFSLAIMAGFKAMAMILAYLMFFTIAIYLLEEIGAFDLISNPTVVSCVKGIFEMTIGINLMGMCDIAIEQKVVLASMLVSFGGLSVIGQSMSMARGSGLKLRDIIEIKITHGMIATIVATILLRFVVI